MKKILSIFLFTITGLSFLTGCLPEERNKKETYKQTIDTHVLESAYQDSDTKITKEAFIDSFKTNFQINKHYKQARIAIHAIDGFSEKEKEDLSINEDPIILATVREGLYGFPSIVNTYFGASICINCSNRFLDRAYRYSTEVTLSLAFLTNMIRFMDNNNGMEVNATSFYKYKIINDEINSVCYFDEDYYITSFSTTINERRFNVECSYFNIDDTTNPDYSSFNERLFGYQFANANNKYAFNRIHAHAEGTYYNFGSVYSRGGFISIEKAVYPDIKEDDYVIFKPTTDAPVANYAIAYSDGEGSDLDDSKDCCQFDRYVEDNNLPLYHNSVSSFYGISAFYQLPYYYGMRSYYPVSMIVYATRYSDFYTFINYIQYYHNSSPYDRYELSINPDNKSIIIKNTERLFEQELFFNEYSCISKIVNRFMEGGEEYYSNDNIVAPDIFIGTATYEYYSEI